MKCGAARTFLTQVDDREEQTIQIPPADLDYLSTNGSITVFESQEVPDLMAEAVTLLSGYTSGLERSELVALAVRMIRGV
jgi:hypothetical protein